VRRSFYTLATDAIWTGIFSSGVALAWLFAGSFVVGLFNEYGRQDPFALATTNSLLALFVFAPALLFLNIVAMVPGYYFFFFAGLDRKWAYIFLEGALALASMFFFISAVTGSGEKFNLMPDFQSFLFWLMGLVPAPAYFGGRLFYRWTHESYGTDFTSFLAPSPVIDFDHPDVRATANALAAGKESDIEIAKACFNFVRDEISHSVDARMNPVTCKASDVLKHGTGHCYAKSHLLAALLRANQIPAALCYQRLSIDDKGPPFCLHGLNAVYLKDFGWYRIDPRGNKPGINARFDPPLEHLAFTPKLPGERDLTGRYAEPLFEVVAALSTFKSWDELLENLPDCRSML
jgi:hypothetical protein